LRRKSASSQPELVPKARSLCHPENAPNLGAAADGGANGTRKVVALKDLANNAGHGHRAQRRGRRTLPQVHIAANLRTFIVRAAAGADGEHEQPERSEHAQKQFKAGSRHGLTREMALFQPKTATGKLKAVMMPTRPSGFHISSRKWPGPWLS
jgi:hypothetical protein